MVKRQSPTLQTGGYDKNGSFQKMKIYMETLIMVESTSFGNPTIFPFSDFHDST